MDKFEFFSPISDGTYQPDDLVYFHTSKYKLAVKPSTISGAGNGVFALENIPKGEIIDAYVGKILLAEKEIESYYIFEFDEKYQVDGETNPRCFMAMINDAIGSKHKYNCEFEIEEIDDEQQEIVDRALEYDEDITYDLTCVKVKAIKKINKGDELFVAYGEDYWETGEESTESS